MTALSSWDAGAACPIDIVEQVVVAKDWAFERPSDEEMAVQMPGRWCDLSFFVSWEEMLSTMQFTLSLQMRVPGARRTAVYETLALINDKVWMGHFSVWQEEGLLVFRHALPMRGSHAPTQEQVEDVIQNALMECERFYPAFQYVLWGGKSPAEVFERLGDAAAAAHHAALAARPAAIAEMRDPVWREVEAAGASRRWYAIRGKRHLDEGRLGEAVAELSVAVAQGQTDPLIWLNYGTALAALERTREAVEALETALTLATAADTAVALDNEITALILNNLGVAQFRRGQVLTAEERFRQALAVDPTSERAVANLAAVLATRRRLAEAIALIEEALAERPSPMLERLQRVLPLRPAEPVLGIPDAAASADTEPGAARGISPP